MEAVTAWAHLPNAKHIDRILEAVCCNPKDWVLLWDRDSSAAYTVAWKIANGLTRGKERNAAWNAADNATNVRARNAAVSALNALIAWDDCAYILGLHPNVVRLMAASGNQPAILLEAAVIAMHEEPKP